MSIDVNSQGLSLIHLSEAVARNEAADEHEKQQDYRKPHRTGNGTGCEAITFDRR